MATARQSILDYLTDYVLHHGDEAAALCKRDGAYRSTTWREVGDAVQRQATVLLRLGLAPGQRVALLAQTRLEWVTWDLAIIAAGGVTVPIYQSSLPDDCQFILDNSGARFVVSENEAQTRKLLQQRGQLAGVERVIQIDPPVGEDGWVASMAALVAAVEVADEAALALRRRELTPASPLSLIYTSGTTGRPKGAIITHHNLLATAEAIGSVDIVRTADTQLLFLPLAHVFARVLMVAWLATRHRLAFAESMATIAENMCEVRPTIMCGVPRVFEKFFAAVQQKGASRGRLASALFARSLALSERAGEAAQRGASLPPRERLEFALLKRAIFRRVGSQLAATLGGRMRVMISGGAPLAPPIAWFFRHAGIPLVEGFGLTETSAATCLNLPADNRIGSVGRPLPGTSVRCAADGELLIRGGGVFAGYWNNPQASAEALVDGWFLSGDLARIDETGFVHIVDRKKDIIVTAGGKNVAPQNIEGLIKTDKFISQVVVHGDRRNFLSALITLDATALQHFAQAHGLGAGSFAELSQNPRVVAEIGAIIDRFNGQLPKWETIKKFRILEHDFSVESGELTASLKVKRRLVNERYRAIFDGFYAAASPPPAQRHA